MKPVLLIKIALLHQLFSLLNSSTFAAKSDTLFSDVFPRKLLSFGSEVLGNNACRRDCEKVLTGVENLDLWAFKFVDAGSKLQSGILSGNIQNYGDFDECIQNVAENQQGEALFSGKYCLAHVHFEPEEPHLGVKNQILDYISYGRRHIEITKNRTNLNVKFPDILPSLALFKFAACVPSSCTPVDVERMLNVTLKTFYGDKLGLNAYAEVFEENCHTNTTKLWSREELIFVTVLGLLFAAAIIGTYCDNTGEDEFDKKDKPQTTSAWSSFSLKKNWSNLVSTKDVQQNTIECIDGLRFYNTLCVVLCHVGDANFRMAYTNKKSLYDAIADVINTPIFNVIMSVDVFLVIGGTLRAYNMVRDLEMNKYSYFTDFLRRYLRLTPAYALVIAFYATVFSRTGSGPTWNKCVGQSEQVCQQVWPLNLLYINNLVHKETSCILQSWYLATDMQLYLIAPFIIYPLWKRPLIGRKILYAAFSLSIFIPTSITFFTKGIPLHSASFSDEAITSYFNYIHMFTPSRMSPYFIGIALGLLLHNINSHGIGKLPKSTVWLGWIFSAAIFLTKVYGSHYFIRPAYQYSFIESVLYAGLHRAVFGFSVAWLIFACYTGYGGAASKFLSSKAYQPLSKLSYCIFLTHMIVVSFLSGTSRTAKHMSVLNVFHDFFGSMLFTIIPSIILHLLVEAPFNNLSSKFLKSRNANTKEKKLE